MILFLNVQIDLQHELESLNRDLWTHVRELFVLINEETNTKIQNIVSYIPFVRKNCNTFSVVMLLFSELCSPFSSFKLFGFPLDTFSLISKSSLSCSNFPSLTASNKGG